MSVTSKDTIYVDIDDEITTVIDKVRSSSARVVALVLPKRAAVFQSIVNMKLLKRSAETAKKHIVLVTTEASLLPLASTVGLHVAATPQSRPEVPAASSVSPPSEEDITDEGDAYTASNAGTRPIGELAGMEAASQEMETLSLPDDEQSTEAATPVGKVKKDKHLKVPNFNKFRLGLFLAALLLIALIVGVYYCLMVLPKAAIAISTKASTVNINLSADLNPSAQALDASKSVLPAKIEQQQKTTTQQVAATGQQNNGAVASGSVTLTACETSIGPVSQLTVPAGTGLSVNGLTFITQAATSFSKNGVNNGNGCIAYPATGDTPITAQNAGAKYNVSNVSFTVSRRSDVTGAGSATGGTDNIIHIVLQADIDSAKAKLAAADSSSIKTALTQTLRQDGKYPLPVTFAAGAPVITSDNQAGATADNVTITQAVTYTMFGVTKMDLETLLKSKISNQVDMRDQAIVDDGLGSATIAVTDTSNGVDHITLQTASSVGPDLKPDDIKKQVAGKKAGDVKLAVNSLPGVTQVDVRLSPFWVASVPTNLNKITVTITGTK